MSLATFAAGCFWGVEAEFAKVPGVISAMSGYTGGTLANPSYEDVCSDETGHAEAVQIEFDSAKVSYEDLVKLFWRLHNPTQLNRQGPDVGSQYRSVIFVHDKEQARVAQASLAALKLSGKFKRPIVTSIEPCQTFYPAEEHHQRYYEKHGLKSCIVMNDVD